MTALCRNDTNRPLADPNLSLLRTSAWYDPEQLARARAGSKV